MNTQEIAMIIPVELDEESKELLDVLVEMKKQIHETAGVSNCMLAQLQVMVDTGMSDRSMYGRS